MTIVCINKGYRFQLSTFGKRLIVNARHRRGDGSGGQIRALLECIAADTRDTIPNDDARNGRIVGF